MYQKRREILRTHLHSKPFTTYSELEVLFPDVSGMTIRRDIDYFESIGEVIKVRSGARSMKYITTSFEAPFSHRASQNIRSKRRIAKFAAGIIEAGRSVFIDSGTTALELASFLPDERHNITTTSPSVALSLMDHRKSMVYLVGGLLHPESLSVSGLPAISYINEINIDLAILTPSGFSLKDGFTCGNYGECELKRLVVSKARSVIILADINKLDRSLPYTFCSLDQVHDLVLDAPLPEDFTREAEQKKVKIHIAE